VIVNLNEKRRGEDRIGERRDIRYEI